MRIAVKNKSDSVESLLKELTGSKIIGVISLEGLPNNQLKKLRQSLTDVKLLVKSKNIMTRALEKHAKGYEGLIPYLKGACALFTTKTDAFMLSVMISKLREPAYIKAGQTVNTDIIIDAGPTPFMPGPMMTEMAELGIKASAKGGKLTISEPANIAKAGSKVNPKIASFLFKLGLKPVTTGVDILAVLDDGKLFTQNQLIVDVKATIDNLIKAYANALNLSYNAGIINKATIELLLKKAYSQAKNLAREAAIITNDNAGEIMLIAQSRAAALAGSIKWEVK